MKIAAHITKEKNADSLLLETLQIIATKHPNLSVVFFVDKKIEGLATNCKQIVLNPKPKNNFLLYFWYTFKLHALLKKEKCNIFISEAGLLCPKFNLPQFLFFSNVQIKKKGNRFYKKPYTTAIHNAKNIFVTEDFIYETIVSGYKVNATKVKTIYHGIVNKHPIGIKQSNEQIKEQYTNGFDYFLYPVTDQNAAHVLTTLKAFSQLKKWQKSTMKMVLLLKDISATNLIPDFKNYKYKSDVIFIEKANNPYNEIVEAAFTVINFCKYSNNSISFVALQKNVPLIAADNNINKSIFGQAAIYCDTTEKGMSEKMQLIYKDEALKNNLNFHGNILLKKYAADKAAQDLYNMIAE
jgi:hypothetical protein